LSVAEAEAPSPEFDLIARHFDLPHTRGDVVLGIGDDAALLQPPPGLEVAATVDTLVEGVHFPRGTPAESLGHKAAAVNLSDLAAMGAEPTWATLALTLPGPDEAFLSGFARGLRAILAHYGVALVGGDTTRGPLSVTLQLMGLVPAGRALRRDGARAGELVFVTGSVGDAALGLSALVGSRRLDGAAAEACLHRLDRPVPRVEAGLALRGLASAAIDISDGLVADLGHVLQASGVGATIETRSLPLSEAVAAVVRAERSWALPLSAGDDYELLFTAPEARRMEILERLHPLPVSMIGRTEVARGLRVRDPEGQLLEIGPGGWDHFAGLGA
jgi:thiamine-monophosphate kinase